MVTVVFPEPETRITTRTATRATPSSVMWILARANAQRGNTKSGRPRRSIRAIRYAPPSISCHAQSGS